MEILPINYKGKITSGGNTETLRQGEEYKLSLGETVKVKVLDYLGGGKLIVDLNGQRIVATSDILIEKGQEIYVRVINIREGKVILQLIPDELLTYELKPTERENLNLGKAIKSLYMLIESLDGSNRNESFVYQIKDILQQVTLNLDMESDPEDIAKQIHESIIMLGYNYEHDLAKLIKRDHEFFINERPILKSRLLNLLLLIQHDELKDRDYNEELKGLIEELLRNVEYQQLRSILDGKIYVNLPIIMGDEEATAELEFFRYKGNKHNENNSLNISIRFNLETIGYVEFIINIVDKDISCQVKANRHDTYIRLKNQLSVLEKRFIDLGYNITGIFCSQNTQRIYSLNTKC